jgi:hypothetical protein
MWGGLFSKASEQGGLIEYVRRLPELAPALAPCIYAVHFHLGALDLRESVAAARGSRFDRFN